MAHTDWKIAKSTRTCFVSDKKFDIGDSFYSVLIEEDGGFQRRDYAIECFEEHRPENIFSYWKTTVPEEREEKNARPVLDLEFVMDFFRRLEGKEEDQSINFRYVLALMLTRKRALKLKGGKQDEQGRDLLLFTEGRKGEKQIKHEVLQPCLDENEITLVSEELGVLLGIAPPPETPESKNENEDEDAATEIEADESDQETFEELEVEERELVAAAGD